MTKTVKYLSGEVREIESQVGCVSPLPEISPEQLEEIAQAYCRNRTMQDRIPRNYREHVQVAQLLAAWYYAFNEVLNPVSARIQFVEPTPTGDEG